MITKERFFEIVTDCHILMFDGFEYSDCFEEHLDELWLLDKPRLEKVAQIYTPSQVEILLINRIRKALFEAGEAVGLEEINYKMAPQLSVHDRQRILKYKREIDKPFHYVGMRNRIVDLINPEVALVKFLVDCDYKFGHDNCAMVEHKGRGLKNEKSSRTP